MHHAVVSLEIDEDGIVNEERILLLAVYTSLDDAKLQIQADPGYEKFKTLYVCPYEIGKYNYLGDCLLDEESRLLVEVIKIERVMS